jgi:hypothetical protein
MTASRILKWVTGVLEAILGIPILGAVIVLSSGWTVLMVMLVLHVITLALSVKNREQYRGSVLGIIGSALGWIPGVGIVMHILSAIFLMITATSDERRKYRTKIEIVEYEQAETAH